MDSIKASANFGEAMKITITAGALKFNNSAGIVETQEFRYFARGFVTRASKWVKTSNVEDAGTLRFSTDFFENYFSKNNLHFHFQTCKNLTQGFGKSFSIGFSDFVGLRKYFLSK